MNLLFFSSGNISFALDAEQVDEVTAYDAEANQDIFWFHQEFSFDQGGGPVQSPKILTVRTDGGGTFRIIVDALDDIAYCNMDEIQPFPALLEPFVLRYGMWGVLHRAGKFFILVDILRWLRNRKKLSSVDGE